MGEDKADDTVSKREGDSKALPALDLDPPVLDVVLGSGGMRAPEDADEQD